jgi:hypothetical protein
MTRTLPIVRTLCWANISRQILIGQEKVFKKLGARVDQQIIHKKDHGEWMTSIIAQANTNDILIFCDIDAFPLSRSALEEAVMHAESGSLYGLAQVANHLENPSHIYAGPMFLCFKKQTWSEAGEPDLKSSPQFDVAQRFTQAIEQRGNSVKLIYPTATIISKWPLGSKGVFGIGTFYEEKFFHLFESRKASNVELFRAVAEDVSNGKKLDFKKYIEYSKKSRDKSDRARSKDKLIFKVCTIYRLLQIRVGAAIRFANFVTKSTKEKKNMRINR